MVIIVLVGIIFDNVSMWVVFKVMCMCSVRHKNLYLGYCYGVCDLIRVGNFCSREFLTIVMSY